MGSEKWLSAKPSTHLWSSCKPTSISGWRITTTTGHIQGIYCFGNTLMQTFLDSRQLAWDKIWIGRYRPLRPLLDDLVCQIKFRLLHVIGPDGLANCSSRISRQGSFSFPLLRSAALARVFEELSRSFGLWIGEVCSLID